ncbi:hypothetical protein ASE07_18825 [Noviherbaspirillum sp. Root189]|nr:hypothetical protein ASE07_18825 [Noviherbaspirillum sp. Root189]
MNLTCQRAKSVRAVSFGIFRPIRILHTVAARMVLRLIARMLIGVLCTRGDDYFALPPMGPSYEKFHFLRAVRQCLHLAETT